MFPAEPLPDKLGTYKVVRRLSGTGTVETYLGRSEGPMGFQRECVLKLMVNTSEGSARFAEELAREAAICSRITHPNIVRMFDFFEHDKKLVLVLEYIESVSLSELLSDLADKHKSLGDPVIYHVGHQMAGALAHAHAATDEKGKSTPIIHRNLHPDNILLGLDGHVRLTGFGVGKILGRTPDTAIGTVKGRPGYMAPEQARGEPVTPKADVYGLGLLLWSLFTGLKPPDDGTFPARIGTLRGDLPREISAMIDAALDRFPGTRKLSAREIEQWLAKIVPTEKGKTELRELVTAYREEHPPVEPVENEAPTRPSSAGENAPAAPAHLLTESDGPTQPLKAQNALSALLNPPPERDTTTRLKAPPAPPERDTSARLKALPAPPERDTTARLKAPLAPPAAASPAPAVRFGEPPPGLPPAPPLPKRKEDWRTALPEVDNLDDMFEATKAPRTEGERISAPSPEPAAPRPPSASAIPAPPRPRSSYPGAPAIPAPPAPAGKRISIPGVPPTPIAITPAAPVAAPAKPPLPVAPTKTLVSTTPPLVPEAPAAPAAAAPGALSPAPPAAAPAGPAAPITFGAPTGASKAPSEPSLELAPAAVEEPVHIDANRSPIPLAPPPSAGVAPLGTPPVAPPMAPPAAPRFHVAETLPPPPDDALAKDRPALPWKDTQLGQRSGRDSSASLLLRMAPRSIPLGMTIVVSALTATVVVVIALYTFLHRPSPPAASDTPAAKATAAATVALTRPAPPTPPAPPPPQATIAAPAAAATARAALAAPAAPASDLPAGFGYLVASFPTPGEVYVSGKPLGPANEPLKVSCGRWFVRIGEAGGGKFPEWVSAGQTVNVACQSTTTAVFKPGSGAPKKR